MGDLKPFLSMHLEYTLMNVKQIHSQMLGVSARHY